MSDLIFIDGLPPSTNKGLLLGFLIEQAGIKKEAVGRIEISGSLATIGLSAGKGSRAVRALDGARFGTRNVRVWQQPTGAGKPHFEQLRRWLRLEAEAEREQRALDAGKAEFRLTKLIIKGSDIGLGGRFLLRLGLRNEQAQLPWSRLSVGSPVILQEDGQPAATGTWRAVVSRLKRHVIELALNGEVQPAGNTPTFSVHLASDEIARQRMERAMTRIENAPANRTAELRDVILGERTGSFSGANVPAGLARFTQALNASQKEAVRHALAAEDVAIIHGPPGTGKTTTLGALITAAVANGDRVLACAPSNLAVDNIAERLLHSSLQIVRIGHPVRVTSNLQGIVLDALVEKEADYRQAKRLRKEAFGLRDQASKFRRAKPARGEKAALRQEANEMLAEARQLEAMAVDRVLDKAQVILVTLTGIDSSIIGQRRFDLCVIDEAGQSSEPACWIPLTRSNRVILAGDHQQLPPTILSPKAEREGFGRTMLEQLMVRAAAGFSRRLDIQYRMHETIMGFSGVEFYEGTLVAAGNVAHHLLADCAGVEATQLTATPLTYIDTAGASYDEEVDAQMSRRNPQEAALAARKVSQLVDAGVPGGAIAVITPYSAQVDLLRELLGESIEVNSIDGFQGREQEVIIISLVRSNTEGQIGFLAETRRMNVALTRARRKLIVIGDSGTVAADPFYGRLIDYCEQQGAYHSVWEEMV